ncbi:hypothetical protein SBA3_910030 [Candidatus Sulfopaludibacter sp. SbA3]|nr:hypothetical protein SBA3_910030 [Candidatus Sulfopaludibacter sp. SbA3]
MAARNASTWIARAIIALLILGSLLTVGVTWLYFTWQRDAIESEMSGQIAAVAEAKARQLANWRRERLGDGRVFVASVTMKTVRRVLARHAATDSDRADLVAELRQLEEQFLYSGAFLVDREGGVLLRYPADRQAPSHLGEWARTGSLTDEVKLEDLYLDSHAKRPLMALIVPVRGSGAIVLEIDPSRFLYPYLNSTPAPGSSTETLLVRLENDREYIYLNDLRYHPGAALVWQRPIPSGLTAHALESEQQLKLVDYRGILVLGTIRPVPESPWLLLAKIDVAEVDAPVRRLGWEMALIAASIGIASACVMVVVWREQHARIHRERDAWYRAAANDTPAYLWMTTQEGANSFINIPLARFLGTDPEVLSGDWADFPHPDDVKRVRSTFLDSVAARREWVAEFRIRRFDGQYRWVIGQALPRYSPEGLFLGYAGSFIDITGRREAERQLRTANAALETELAERTRHELEIESLSARLINAQEEERGRLARELHDDLCQQIAALSIAMGTLKRQVPENQVELRGQTDRIQQKLVQTAEAVRRISHQLHPAVLEHSGLASALRAYCEEFGSLTGIRVKLETDGHFDGISPFVALNLYRITQEGLQNVARHARTEEASVSLRQSAECLCLTIADRGVGMESVEASSSGGLGLLSIKERARLIGGSVDISTGPKRGTSIFVRTPRDAAGTGQTARVSV